MRELLSANDTQDHKQDPKERIKAYWDNPVSKELSELSIWVSQVANTNGEAQYLLSNKVSTLVVTFLKKSTKYGFFNSTAS